MADCGAGLRWCLCWAVVPGSSACGGWCSVVGESRQPCCSRAHASRWPLPPTSERCATRCRALPPSGDHQAGGQRGPAGGGELPEGQERRAAARGHAGGLGWDGRAGPGRARRLAARACAWAGSAGLAVGLGMLLVAGAVWAAGAACPGSSCVDRGYRASTTAELCLVASQQALFAARIARCRSPAGKAEGAG